MFGNIADLLIIVLGFGVLIFVHELGHFLAAKWAGIRAEAFAVGMGPVAMAWRSGIGLRFGSTMPEYTRRAHKELVEHKTEPTGRNEKGDPAYTEAQMLKSADSLGFGETEYSLRWLPIGGFVKMLGQEDMNPNKTSDDSRSYNSCSIGKRMIVVSAGVIMNIIFAAILYIVAFSIGVRFEAPVLGNVSPSMPAFTAVAENADTLNITTPGIMPGDRVVTINDNPVHTFADIQITTAMAKPDEALHFVIERAGYDEPLRFDIKPTKDDLSGLLGIGVAPASSTTLLDDFDEFERRPFFEETLLPDAGVTEGMSMLAANGQQITTYEQFHNIVNQLDGQPVPTTWSALDDDGLPTATPIEVAIDSVPRLQQLVFASTSTQSISDYDFGLFGFVPLARINWLDEKSPNVGILLPDDIILRLDDVYAPQRGMCQYIIQTHENETIDMVVWRDGQEVDVTATIGRGQRLGVLLGSAMETLRVAVPVNRIMEKSDEQDDASIAADTPIAPFNILPGTLITSVGDQPVTTWRDLRETAKQLTATALTENTGATLNITTVNPTPGREVETITLNLSAQQVAALHDLGWESTVSEILFESLMTTRKADNPMHAIGIGIDETHKTMVLTYLTIDRLIRGSVGVEQLRGPVGIVHIGSKIAGKGFVFVLYFLAIISVNLAVINFLPLPIVDGGLFLFLIYEKFKGRPPSAAFQHWATVAGLFMIGTAFLVVTWNDVMRLIP